MPGRIDRDDKLASYMTGASLHRTGLTAVDDNTSFDAAPVIDLGLNRSAAGNAIHVIANRTAGAGTAALELWRKLTRDGPAFASWIKVDAVATVATGTEYRFTGLVAAQYKLKVTGVGSSTWDLYEYHSES